MDDICDTLQRVAAQERKTLFQDEGKLGRLRAGSFFWWSHISRRLPIVVSHCNQMLKLS